MRLPNGADNLIFYKKPHATRLQCHILLYLPILMNIFRAGLAIACEKNAFSLTLPTDRKFSPVSSCNYRISRENNLELIENMQYK